MVEVVIHKPRWCPITLDKINLVYRGLQSKEQAPREHPAVMDIDAAFVLEDFESLSALQKRNISSNKLFEYVKKINIAYASSCEEIARLNSEEIVSSLLVCSRRQS